MGKPGKLGKHVKIDITRSTCLVRQILCNSMFYNYMSSICPTCFVQSCASYASGKQLSARNSVWLGGTSQSCTVLRRRVRSEQTATEQPDRIDRVKELVPQAHHNKPMLTGQCGPQIISILEYTPFLS